VQVEETLAIIDAAPQPVGKTPCAGFAEYRCMLRGGAELLEHAKKRLERGHKEVTQTAFLAGRGECIGSVHRGSRDPGNYAIRNLTPTELDRLIERSATQGLNPSRRV